MAKSKDSRYPLIIVKRDVRRRLQALIDRKYAERGHRGGPRIGCGTVIEEMLDAQHPETKLTEEACHQ